MPARGRARAGTEPGLVGLLPVALATKDRPDVGADVTPAEGDDGDIGDGDIGDGDIGDGDIGDGDIGDGDIGDGDIGDGDGGPLVVSPSPAPDGPDPHAETDTTTSPAMATAIGRPGGGRCNRPPSRDGHIEASSRAMNRPFGEGDLGRPVPRRSRGILKPWKPTSS